MIPLPEVMQDAVDGVPRIRGDDPDQSWYGVVWGVFPASAGMILMLMPDDLTAKCVPRIRGDDPWPKGWPLSGFPCSPHPRG